MFAGPPILTAKTHICGAHCQKQQCQSCVIDSLASEGKLLTFIILNPDAALSDTELLDKLATSQAHGLFLLK